MDKTASLTLVANQSTASSVPVERTMDLVSVESFERLERECQQPVVAFINLDDSLYDDVSESALDMSDTLRRVDFVLKHAPTKVKQEPCSQTEEDNFEQLNDYEQSIPVPNIVQDSRRSDCAEIPHLRFINNELPQPRASETQLEDVSCPSLLLQNMSTFGHPLTSSSMIDKSTEFRKTTIPEERLPILVENGTSVPASEPPAPVTIKAEPGVAVFNDLTIPSLFLRESMFNDRLIDGNTDLVEELFPSRILERNIEIEEAENNSRGAAPLDEDVVMTSAPDLTAGGSQNEQGGSAASKAPEKPAQKNRSSAPIPVQPTAVINPRASLQNPPSAAINPVTEVPEQFPGAPSSVPAIPERSPTAVIRDQPPPVADKASAPAVDPSAAGPSMPVVQRHILSNILATLETRPEDFEKLNSVIAKDVFVGSIEETMNALPVEPQPVSNPSLVAPVLAEAVSSLGSRFENVERFFLPFLGADVRDNQHQHQRRFQTRREQTTARPCTAETKSGACRESRSGAAVRGCGDRSRPAVRREFLQAAQQDDPGGVQTQRNEEAPGG